MQKVDRSAASNSKALVLAAADGFASDDRGVSFYLDPPQVEVSIREFEDFTLSRLRVLHVVDRLCNYDTRLENIPDLKPKIASELNDAHLALPDAKQTTDFLSRKADFVRRDAISHFALRLAFCKTRDARDWFLKQEQRLFVLRFDSLEQQAKDAYLVASGLQCRKWKPANPGELTDMQHATAGAKIWRNDGSPPEYDGTFYDMPFFEVPPSLISSRRVVIKGGTAFVPSSALKLILAKSFRDRLASNLDVAFQGLPTALADPRVGGLLRQLQDHGMQLLVAKGPGGSSEEAGEKLSLENFEALMVRSFPPCMRRLVEHQREAKKHLKHMGRLQLRPFLKDCGFTIEDSFRWWRQELTRDPEINTASYEKNYTYDVEHAYGKKGHLQGQNAFGCPKIIAFPGESGGQRHGCPFKQLEAAPLRQQLQRWQVPETQLGEIEKLLGHGQKHYQLACIEYFRGIHPGHEGDGVGNAPSDFLRESCRCHLKNKEAEQKASGSPAKPA